MTDTLCWDCANACNCRWVCHFQPIEGWRATPTIVGERNTHSYMVTACPLFEPDRKHRVTGQELTRLLHISSRTLIRYPSKKIKRLVRRCGYELFIDEPLTPNEHRKYYIARITHKENNNGKV